jgi:methanethiol S-methyltransferase
MISHSDLFGVRQVWLYLRGKEYTSLPFHTPMLYSYVRHPLYVGWFMVFWVTPMMSVGHLLFAGTLTAYILLASKIEERDLTNHFGRLYEDYRRRVPAFLPRIGRRKSNSIEPAEVSAQSRFRPAYPVVQSDGKGTSSPAISHSAFWAACCSASFLLRPHAG